MRVVCGWRQNIREMGAEQNIRMPSQPHLYSCFDASSCALMAHLVEHSATACFARPQSRPLHKALPRVFHRWMRRNSHHALEMLQGDVADVALDAFNAVEPHLAVALVFMAVWLCLLALKQSRAINKTGLF